MISKTDIISDFTSDYYMRMTVLDIPGVLSQITSIFADNNISITSMRQDAGEGVVSIVLVTHKSSENNIRKAISEIESLNEVQKVNALIRVEK